MLMYAQDEFGYVSDEIITEIARRLDLRTVQVEETLEYYSMLHRKPRRQIPRAGVHQRCLHAAWRQRNSCEQAKKRLEIGHKETTNDGVFSLEEVECIGRLHRRTRDAGELRFLRKPHAPCNFRHRSSKSSTRVESRAPVPIISGALHPNAIRTKHL